MKRLLILSAIVFLTGWAAALAQLHFWALKAESRLSENPMPADIAVHGLVIHPTTGKLTLVVDGSPEAKSLSDDPDNP